MRILPELSSNRLTSIQIIFEKKVFDNFEISWSLALLFFSASKCNTFSMSVDRNAGILFSFWQQYLDECAVENTADMLVAAFQLCLNDSILHRVSSKTAQYLWIKWPLKLPH
ncbi:hypothetical protein T01_9771 [Trichinella spiralis]|uniref:Uncharacterized protein n=1 Tax=Trichinella spiralis TaxID=6334 RepID=A0A0V1B9I0_TRISP|nr:hypothetical protein T01_9771 [Trichinella spiralis]